MNRHGQRWVTGPKLLSAVLCVAIIGSDAGPAVAQTTQRANGGVISADLTGRRVEEVRIIGKNKPLGTISDIQRQIRTREGERLDPATVEEDYKRINSLRRFSNVEARIEPTATGVIVVFELTEQSQIKEIRFIGNTAVENNTLIEAINIRPGEAIDSFRLGLAQESIQRLYLGKNFPQARVEIDQEQLNQNGILLFRITEGPRVRVRKVRVLGNKSFTNQRIKDQAKTRSWFPFLVSGRYDPDQVDQDVASIRNFYQDRGFFDVRVGRNITVGPDQKEVMVSFVIEEGPRYQVDKVTFQGNASIPPEQLRENLKLLEGRAYDRELVQRDIREIVKVYSPLGYIYLPNDPNPDPDYMRIREQRIFRG